MIVTANVGYTNERPRSNAKLSELSCQASQFTIGTSQAHDLGGFFSTLTEIVGIVTLVVRRNVPNDFYWRSYVFQTC